MFKNLEWKFFDTFNDAEAKGQGVKFIVYETRPGNFNATAYRFEEPVLRIATAVSRDDAMRMCQLHHDEMMRGWLVETEELFLVFNPAMTECVGFLDESDYRWTMDGKTEPWGNAIPSIGDDFREMYATMDDDDPEDEINEVPMKYRISEEEAEYGRKLPGLRVLVPSSALKDAD
jgi:hypothetical protein